MPFNQIRSLIQPDIDTVEALLQEQEPSSISLINELIVHVTRAGGKRLRPLVLLMMTKALGGNDPHAITLAGALELIHTATLLHDDVVDESQLRRGRQTANHLWGNPASILVGDFLYSRAFRWLAQTERLDAIKIFAASTNDIAEGEVLQLMHRHNINMTVSDYLLIIARKTGKLFEVAAQTGALLADDNPQTQLAAAQYGLNLGIAFQITDDILDYLGKEQELGKQPFDDLKDGSLTLPILYVLEKGSAEEKLFIQKIIQDKEVSDPEKLKTMLHQSGAIEYAYNIAKEYVAQAENALTTFPHTAYRDALSALVNFAINRCY
jgi:octaprenyl-diphosphate synthase